MTHTPGPWRYLPGDGIFSEDDANGHPSRLASLTYGKGGRIRANITDSELETNGRLMAAAPELADLLYSILTALRGGDYCPYCGDEPQHDAECPVIRAHALLEGLI